MTARRHVTRALALLMAVLLVVDVTVAVVAGDLSDRLYIAVAACIAAGTTGLAVRVARRQPGNLVAALLAWMGLLAVLLPFSDTYLPARARHPSLPALPDAASVLLAGTWIWFYIAVALVMLWFPDGRLPSPRWRWVAVGLPVVGVAVGAIMATSPGPYDAPFGAVHHPLGDLSTGASTVAKAVFFTALVALSLACAASLRVRFRRGDAVLRAQLKWMALATLAVPATVLLSWVGQLLLGTHALAEIGFAALYVAVPVATAIAILRHNLYDVDRALSSTVTYSVLTTGVLGVFALASVATGIVLGRDSAVAAALVTAVTTLALAPVRRRLQRRVDQRLYPLRQAALDALEALRAAIIRGQTAPEQLEEVLRDGLRDPALRVGVALPGGAGFVDLRGDPLELAATATPVSVHGERIGVIATHGPAQPPLLREVAEASAMLVEMVRLRLELSAAVREVASSRSRLQRVGDAERRRLERDLHDGAQQRLVSLGMALRLAQRHLGDQEMDLDGLLDEAVAQLGTAVAELREVAHGLRPSALDEGLGPALSSLADAATLPIDLEVQADRAIPDDIATTTYYVVSESVANAVKHAEATRIRLHVSHAGDQLRVRIEDDGCGGATLRPGSGLAGLSDRVAAAGGSLRVTSPPSEGTAVEVTLPCAS